METQKIIIRLFGAFRALGSELVVEVGEHETAASLKRRIAGQLNGQLSILAEDSVIASTKRILADHESLEERTGLSLLPPVCGG